MSVTTQHLAHSMKKARFTSNREWP